jgi:hypothetical protein
VKVVLYNATNHPVIHNFETSGSHAPFFSCAYRHPDLDLLAIMKPESAVEVTDE